MKRLLLAILLQAGFVAPVLAQQSNYPQLSQTLTQRFCQAIKATPNKNPQTLIEDVMISLPEPQRSEVIRLTSRNDRRFMDLFLDGVMDRCPGDMFQYYRRWKNF